MFLTQLKLTHQNLIDFRITDDYSIHRIVYSIFLKEDKNRILYIDKGFQKKFRIVWILSQTEPQATLDDYKIESHPVSAGFLNHTRFNFEILLNPVKKSKATGKLIPIRIPPKKKEDDEQDRAKELLDWFFKKTEENGFQPDRHRLQYFVKPAQKFSQKNESANMVVHNQVLFTGTLTVTDPDLFRHAFENGIGRAKAFGFGLLQLVPIFD